MTDKDGPNSMSDNVFPSIKKGPSGAGAQQGHPGSTQPMRESLGFDRVQNPVEPGTRPIPKQVTVKEKSEMNNFITCVTK